MGVKAKVTEKHFTEIW